MAQVDVRLLGRFEVVVAGSRFVPLDSRNHILRADEPAFGRFVEEVERFLTDTRDREELDEPWRRAWQNRRMIDRTSEPVRSAGDVLQAVRELAVGLQDHIEEIDRSRRLPDELVVAIRRSGINRLVMPAELGGVEAPVADAMTVFETLAAVDGSTAWCATISAGSNFFSGHLPESGARAAFADPDQSTATMLATTGTLRRDGDERFVLSGRWPFASNSLHSTWIGLGGRIEPNDGDEPVGAIAFVPMADVSIDDTWYSSGLRGTGSHDIVAVDVPVPVDRCYIAATSQPWPAGALFRLPLHSGLIPLLSSVPLGIARGAVDEVVRQLREGRGNRRGQLADDRVSLADLAAADAALRAARAGLREQVEDARQLIEAAQPVPRAKQAQLALACLHAVETSVEVTSVAHRLGGGAAAYHGNRLLRALDDVHAARQHLLFSHQHRPELALIAAGRDQAYPPFVL